MVAQGILCAQRKRSCWFHWTELTAFSGMFAFATLWVISPGFVAFFQESTAPVTWALILAFGLAVSTRAHLIGALVISILMAFSPGWLLIAPVYGAMIWNERRAQAPYFWML